MLPALVKSARISGLQIYFHTIPSQAVTDGVAPRLPNLQALIETLSKAGKSSTSICKFSTLCYRLRNFSETTPAHCCSTKSASLPKFWQQVRFFSEPKYKARKADMSLYPHYNEPYFKGTDHRAMKRTMQIIMVGGIGLGMVWWHVMQNLKVPEGSSFSIPPAPVVKDYGLVCDVIASLLEAEDHDDGSFGPLLVRLAWHASGTYDKATNTGGSNGATMRYAREGGDAANKGLQLARELLEPVKQRFSWLSYADLWTLAGAVAVEEMGGPHIPWRPGRVDADNEDNGPPNGRLPDATSDGKGLRDVFNRMGFSDQEIVALAGAHCLGRCHQDRSGYDGPWTNAPTTFSNMYFQELLNNKWHVKKWKGPKQYEDQSGQLMMLPADMALIQDKKLRPYVELYAKDQDRFFEDFAKAFSKLLELGVEFPADSKYI